MAESCRGEGKDKEKAGTSAGAGCESDDSETRPKWQRKDRDDEVGDPLSVVGPEILEKILNFLDARSVARCIAVSHGWQTVAISDRLWAPRQCSELWADKAHIPRCSQVRGISRLTAYSLSVMDGKRVRITREDLCDHVWEYRFKSTAPEYWRNLDPTWKLTGPPMRRYFHQDGTLTADPGDTVWGGHECSYSIITSFVGDGRIREHYVRINRWAPMTVSRLEDWSWMMSNDIYYYTSVPDADKPGGTGPLFPVW
ncbi:F-box domain containing protein [Rhynchospora pubera]|uniref:F-box domain containing protein n=1 Tax=Rhynchospora pubera TaxID=906938 RepID=A0AAV8GLH3_9POAL|nr:F-box domain containing protein [Rhynchospora pubera]